MNVHASTLQSNVSSQSRAHLEFEQSTRNAFVFLEERNFSIVSSNANSVVLSNGIVFIDVQHLEMEYSIRVQFWLASNPRKIDLDYFQRFESNEPIAESFDRGVCSKEEVFERLRLQAARVVAFGGKALLGQPEYYDTVAKFAIRHAAEDGRTFARRSLWKDCVDMFKLLVFK